MLEFKNVTKTFGNITALKDVNFKVEKGDFLFVTGPSGAGKTTALRLILRDLLPDEGEIVLDEVDVTKLPKRDVPGLRQEIGVVFQDFKVLPERTLRENVEVALAVTGVEQDEWDDRVENVLRLTGLTQRSELFPSQLSGGELQRVSLARALVVNPKIILADEPTGNLDWKTTDKIMELFQKVNEEGKTVIVATHHRRIIDKLKKEVVELEGGTLVEEKPEPEEEEDNEEKDKNKSSKKKKEKSSEKSEK